MDLANFTFVYDLPLRWSDIDELGHANNARYLTYFEEGRIRYNEATAKWNWKTEGFLIAASHINYRRPLLLRDDPKLYIRISKMGSKSFEMEYVILNKKGELVADGTTVQVAINIQTFATIPVPTDIRAGVLAYEKAGTVA
jgi:acyl-CoA thioester hydrolase